MVFLILIAFIAISISIDCFLNHAPAKKREMKLKNNVKTRLKAA